MTDLEGTPPRTLPTLYRMIAEAQPHMVFVSNPEGGDTYHNKRVLEYTGKSAAQLAGQGWAAVVHPEDRAACLERWTAALASGKRYEHEYRLRRHDGVYRWHLVSAVPVRDARGRILAWLGNSADVEKLRAEREQLERLRSNLALEVERYTLELRERQTLYRTLVESTPDLVCVRQGKWIVFSNSSCRRFFGTPGTKPIPVSVYAGRLHPEDVAPVRKRLAAVDGGRRHRPMEVRLKGPAGKYVEFDLVSTGLTYGNAPAEQLVLRDLSTVKKALGAHLGMERKLRDEEARLALAMKAARMGFWSWDASDDQVTFSDSMNVLLGIGRGEKRLSRVQWHALVHPDDRSRVAKAARACLKHARRTEVQYRTCRPNGTVRWLFGSALPQRDSAGRTARVIGITADVTDRVQAEEKLRRQAGQVRDLLRRMVSIQEGERRSLSHELHDELGQNVAALGVGLRIIRDGLSKGDAGKLAGRIKSMERLIATTVTSLRNVAMFLRPPALDDGLLGALRSHARRFSARTGLKIEVQGKIPRLDRDAELALFRIAQEALANVHKHAQATRARVAVRCREDEVRLVIADNGRGLPKTGKRGRAAANRLGLIAMRERAEALEGTLSIESSKTGVRVTARVPFKRANPRTHR